MCPPLCGSSLSPAIDIILSPWYLIWIPHIASHSVQFRRWVLTGKFVLCCSFANFSVRASRIISSIRLILVTLRRGRPDKCPCSCSYWSSNCQSLKLIYSTIRSTSKSSVSWRTTFADEIFASTKSVINWFTVSWAQCLLLPITPLAPRFIHPAVYSRFKALASDLTCELWLILSTRPCWLRITPRCSSKATFSIASPW